MVRANARSGSRQRVNVRLDALGILLFHELGCDFDSCACFEVLQQHIAPEFRFEFLVVENLEQDNVLAVPCQGPDTFEQVVYQEDETLESKLSDHCPIAVVIDTR